MWIYERRGGTWYLGDMGGGVLIWVVSDYGLLVLTARENTEDDLPSKEPRNMDGRREHSHSREEQVEAKRSVQSSLCYSKRDPQMVTSHSRQVVRIEPSSDQLKAVFSETRTFSSSCIGGNLEPA